MGARAGAHMCVVAALFRKMSPSFNCLVVHLVLITYVIASHSTSIDPIACLGLSVGCWILISLPMIAFNVLFVLPYIVQVMIGLQTVDILHCRIQCCLLPYFTNQVLWALSRTPDGRAYALIISIRLQNTTPRCPHCSFTRSPGMAGNKICFSFFNFL